MRKSKQGSITRSTKGRRNRTKVRRGHKPTRDELLAEAETLGLEQLGWIHGGGRAPSLLCWARWVTATQGCGA
jgi:hypothetical protein